MNVPQPIPYTTDPRAPYPPAGRGWVEVAPDDAGATRIARDITGWLPPSHYVDGMLSTGLYRFFAFESGAGVHVGALRFAGMMGGLDDDSAGLMGDDPSTDPNAGSGTVATLNDAGAGTFSDGSTTYTQGGAGGHEPIPQNDANCTWVPDTSNAQAVAIANSISNSNTPTAFKDQAVYTQVISGVTYKFVMWSGDCRGDGGTYHCVSVFRCNPTGNQPTPAPAASTGSSAGLIFGLLAVAGLAVGGWYAAAGRKKTVG